MNYFEFYPGDYMRDTGELSLAEHGAYLKLMAHYYATERALPADFPALCRICAAMTAPERQAVAKVADLYFPIHADGLRHKNRIDEEVEKAQRRIEAAKINGKHGGRPKNGTQQKPTGFQSANPAETQSGEALHTPHAILQSEKQKTAPKGVDFGDVAPQVVADFTAHRKALRAPITQTGLDAIRREAGKAGLSLEAALAMCCARGWRGFKADWATDQPTARAGPNAAPSKTRQGLAAILEGTRHDHNTPTDLVLHADPRRDWDALPAES